MKKATNRILSFLTAFAMVIGVLVAPFTSANAAEVKGLCQIVLVNKNQPNTLSGIEISIPEFLII